MGQFGIGQAITRFEDPRLLRGGGRFIGDVNLPGQAHAVVVRSMHAHARIRSIDGAAALRAPGALAVFTGTDLARDGLGFADGRFTVAGTDRAVTIKEVARAAFQPAQRPPGVEPGLYETATFAPRQDTWPNGCHVCEVEVDPDTGGVELLGYVVVDDVGTVINPLTLKGQIHGGVAQNVGQALMEQVVYDRESGQLLTASFMDYAMPRADSLCDMHIESNPVPTTLNPLGATGAGEAGTVGALPVVINAVLDALAPARCP